MSTILFLLISLFASGDAKANEVRVRADSGGKSAYASRQVLTALPRKKFRMSAELFKVDDDDESGELVAQKLEAGEFLWSLVCNGCGDEVLSFDNEGVSFSVPDHLQSGDVIEITVENQVDATPAKVTIKIAEASADAGDDSPAIFGNGKKDPKKKDGKKDRGGDTPKDREPGVEEPKPPKPPKKPKGNHDEEKPEKNRGMKIRGPKGNRDSDSDSGSGSGSGSGSSSSGRSGKDKKGSKKEGSYDRDSEERAFGEFFNGSGGGGGSGGSAKPTNARGYNRDNITPVVACAPRRGTNGQYTIQCSQPKELRVRRKAVENKPVNMAGHSVPIVKKGALPSAPRKVVPAKKVAPAKPKPAPAVKKTASSQH